jgi:glutamate racemase
MKSGNDLKSVCIADTCIGGLSVVRSLRAASRVPRAHFMADYAINPLGVKSDSEIAGVVNRWLGWAQKHSDTLVIACNTLSIRYHQLREANVALASLDNVVSMVDCFAAMVHAEAERLANRRVLVIGTEFTAGQDVYPRLLESTLPGVRVSTAPATMLERRIARFQTWDEDDGVVIDARLRNAIGNTDVAVLACTCFPMVEDRLQSMFPGVTFLDPGAYCAGLLPKRTAGSHDELLIRVTGEVVDKARVVEFARSYLDEAANIAR